MSALGLLLGALWGLLDALGTSLGVPKGALEPYWGPFWVALGRSWVTFEPLKGHRTHQGPNWELFWTDLLPLFIDLSEHSYA